MRLQSVLFLTVCVFWFLAPSVLAMPPRDNVLVTQAELAEQARLGINICSRPVRSPGMRGIVNGPGSVRPLVVGTRRFPVVAIKFPDFNNTNAIAQFDSMLFGTWPSRSASDYYAEISYGAFRMTGVVLGWYTSDSVKARYGYQRGFVWAARLVKEAAQKSDATTNYALYDNDDDGYVDAFTCVHAGLGYEESGNGTDIWSHSWDFNSAGIGEYTTNDPRPGYPGQYIKINDYTTDPERSGYTNHGGMVSIGVFCHEWGHALGLPDLYDTGGGGQGLGTWSLMGSGSWGGNNGSPYYPSHMDPWSKMELGWLNPTAVRSRNLYTMNQVENNPKAYWMMSRNRTFTDYFLVENRHKTLFDTLLWNEGLCIYHVEDSGTLARWGNNQVNYRAPNQRYGVALEQADGSDHLYNGSNRGDANDPWPGGLGRVTFDSSTTPNSRTNYPFSAPLMSGCFAKNIPAAAPTMACTLASGITGQFTGGPDAFGYRWIDSDTTGGPTYGWNDISTGGTLLGYGDDARWSFALPYNFSFYGTNYTSVWVCSNGWLSFGSDPGTNQPVNTTIPNAAAPNAAVFAFWDDLSGVQPDSGGVYYRNFGTSPNCSTVVMWKHSRVKGSMDPVQNQVSFEVVLYEGGRIQLRYRDIWLTDTLRKWGRSASVGIENAGGTVGLQYLYNGSVPGNLLANERTVEFRPASVTHDVGCTRILAPTGTVDSNAVVTPACSVYNYGTATESYTVRLKVGLYNQTATVNSHAPGTRAYVTFLNWTALPRGTLAVTCSTELAGDGIPSNDKATGSVTVRVHDVACVSITAPTGSVDSGTVVTPACTVANYGTEAETYRVKMRIGSFYSDSATVTAQAAGARTYVTFPNWNVTQIGGPYMVSCSTALVGDAKTANDKLTGSVTVTRPPIHNVGCTRILAPSGTVDSGASVTPACSVYNYGNAAETYKVRMVIGSGYTDSATVTSHAPSTYAYVTFPSWTALPRGTLAVACSTRLSGDIQTNNDKQTGSVTVQVRDAGPTVILAPTGTVDSGSAVTPQARVKNFGTAAATFNVTFRIGTYSNTQSVTSLAAGDSTTVSFASWTATQRGSNATRCTTALTNDMKTANDAISGSVWVRVMDVAAVRVLAPSGTVDSGATVTPQARVRNTGTDAATFPVTLRIGSGYSNQQTVTSLPAGDSATVSFSSWAAGARGTYAIKCTTGLSGDRVPANDTASGSVTVRVRDVGCTRIAAPTGMLDSGTTVTPACSVYNYGTTTETYQVRMNFGGFYDNTATVTNHAAGTRVYVTFPNWNVVQRGTFAVTCSTRLTGDAVAANDRQTGSVSVQVIDVAPVTIVAPTGTVDSGTAVTPRVDVRNNGTGVVTFDVRLEIGAGYTNTQTVTALAAGATRTIAFGSWIASPRGAQAVKCTTLLAGDLVPGNNKLTGSVDVAVHDIGVAAIVSPAGTLNPGSVTPRATVRNWGTSREPAWVRFNISGMRPYKDSVYLSAGLPFSDTLLSFQPWNAMVGRYVASCTTLLAGDQVPANNARWLAFTVGAPGWAEMKSVPAAPSLRQVKDGGWLALDGQFFYSLKGNKATDFYRYDAATDSWQQLSPIKGGVEARPPHKGAVGVSDGSGSIFATKGNNTQGFWKYSVRGDSWSQQKDVPLGKSNQKVKGGTDLVWAYRAGTPYVYMLKGYKNEFWRYDPAGDTWHALRDAPIGANVKWDKGSWLAADGSNTIYAHKAKYHEMYAYDVAADSWLATPRLKPMPLVGSMGTKKSKDGACATWFDGAIYALKGGNTQEFWRYHVTGDSWFELDTMPGVGSSGRRKKVKAGADIASVGDGVLYALKGNKTNEFWRYIIPAYASESRPWRDGVAGSAVAGPTVSFAVYPNPLAAGLATIRMSPAAIGQSPVAVRVFDASGRLVRQSAICNPHSEVTLDLRHLAAGVYLVRFSAGSCAATQKLVLER